MPRKNPEIKDRKLDGIQITLNEDVQAEATTLLEDVILVHNALPEIDFNEIDTTTTFLNYQFSAPILIDAMTGGTKEAAKINANLAAAAEELGIGMGVGSQRAGLNSEAMAETYRIARKKAPNVFLIANIGGAQLVEGLDTEKIRQIIDMIKADAIAIHLNPLQELVQPEGEPRFRGILDRVSKLSSELDTPIIVKEVGSGLSREAATKLEVAGVSALNVAGLGGTSWAAVEHFRAKKQGIGGRAELGRLFWDWGIPTAASLIEVKSCVKLPIIASGGIRTGLDVAKCIVLGADLVGMAYPLLSAALKSETKVTDLLRKVVFELKSTMFVTGARDIRTLARVRRVVTGRLSEWEASL